ncbi:MAG: GAF domain-containing protein [Acidobacteriota bacterium]
MRCSECLHIFQAIGQAMNSPLGTERILERVAASMAHELHFTGCMFLLTGRDDGLLEPVASSGLDLPSRTYLARLAGSVMADPVKRITPISVTDCHLDPQLAGIEALRDHDVRSMLLLPLKSRGQVIGCLVATATEPRSFTRQDMEILEAASDLCASLALHCMFLRILDDVARAIHSSLDLEDVLRQIARAVTENLRARGCTIRLIDPDRKQMRLAAAFGLSDAYLAKGPVEPDRSLREVLDGRTVAVYDVTSDPRVQYPIEARAEGIASMLAVPLRTQGRVIGALRVYTREPYEFSEDEINLMGTIAEQCSLIIHNAQLYTRVKNQYDTLVGDVQTWFDQYPGAPRA